MRFHFWKPYRVGKSGTRRWPERTRPSLPTQGPAFSFDRAEFFIIRIIIGETFRLLGMGFIGHLWTPWGKSRDNRKLGIFEIHSENLAGVSACLSMFFSGSDRNHWKSFPLNTFRTILHIIFCPLISNVIVRNLFASETKPLLIRSFIIARVCSHNNMAIARHTLTSSLTKCSADGCLKGVPIIRSHLNTKAAAALPKSLMRGRSGGGKLCNFAMTIYTARARIQLSLDNKLLRKRFVRSLLELLLLTHNYAMLFPRITGGERWACEVKRILVLYIISPLNNFSYSPVWLAKVYR